MCYDEKRDGEKWKEGGKLYEKKKVGYVIWQCV